MSPKLQEICILLSGEAGQGIQTIEYFLTHILKNSGYYVFASKEYMSRIRGGNNTVLIRVASHPVSAFSDKIDIIIPLNKNSIKRVQNRITSQTIIIGEKSNIEAEFLKKI